MMLFGLALLGLSAFALTGLLMLGSGALAYRDRLARQQDRARRAAAQMAGWAA